MKEKDTVKGNVKVFCETIDCDSLPDKDFISNFIKDNPFDFKEAIIAHCRTLDKYDVYQWVADDEVKINNLLEENQQLKEQLEASEKARKEAIEFLFIVYGISADYDGFNDVAGLKAVIDDIARYAKQAKKVLDIGKGE